MKIGKPTPSQLEKINRLAKTSLEADEVFVFPDKMIGNGLITDRYFRIMDATLRDFKKDVQAGVSFLLDHPDYFGMRSSLPYGRTFDAQLKTLDEDERVGDETKALFGDHYIPRGVEINGTNTDDIIRQIETGIIVDTSIGFHAGKFLCSICGNPYFGWDSDCAHIAGKEYDGVVCEVHVHPRAILNHNAAVYEGAYPGAGIGMSALSQSTQRDDLVVIEDIKRIENPSEVFGTYSKRHGLHIFAPSGAVKTKTMIRKEDDYLSKELETKVAELESLLAEKNSTLAAAEATISELNAEIGTLQGEIDSLGAKIAELEPLAKDGEKFKNFMVDEAHKWGVKALGNNYKQEMYDKVFATLTVDGVMEFKESFEAQARENIPTGRVTQGATPTNDNKLKDIPDPIKDEKAFREMVVARAEELRKEDPKLSVKESIKLADAELRKEVY